MRSAVRQCALAGVALVGAGMVAATPTPTPTALSEAQFENVAVRLAANSIANIPLNLVQTLANIPAVQYDAVNETTTALKNSGNWWLYIPTNAVGFDQQDLEKVQAITKLLMPVPLVAKALSDPLWLTLAAEAPMTPNCSGIPGPCADPTYFDQYFQVPVWQLLTGYTFPDDLRNTVDPQDETWDGVDIQPDWAGNTYTLDPLGPIKAIWETLTQDPTGFEQGPTAEDWGTALDALAAATFASLNPFVEGTYCLPCQFVVPGAPDSLPKFPLFGKYYTTFNVGQEFTDQSWVGGPTADPNPEDNLTVTNLWTNEAWEQIFHDAQQQGAEGIAAFPDLPDFAKLQLAEASAQVAALVQNAANQFSITGNIEAAKAITASFEDFVANVQDSLQLPQQQGAPTTNMLASVDPTPLAAKRDLRDSWSVRSGVEASAVSELKSLFTGSHEGQRGAVKDKAQLKAIEPVDPKSTSPADPKSTNPADAGKSPSRAALGGVVKSVKDRLGNTARVADKSTADKKDESPQDAKDKKGSPSDGKADGRGKHRKHDSGT